MGADWPNDEAVTNTKINANTKILRGANVGSTPIHPLLSPECDTKNDRVQRVHKPAEKRRHGFDFRSILSIRQGTNRETRDQRQVVLQNISSRAVNGLCFRAMSTRVYASASATPV